jgi:excisionase family DNA binding protein
MCAQANQPHGVPLALTFPPAAIDAIASRVVELLGQQDRSSSSPWLDVDQAAVYIAASRQRLYDLVHAGTLRPARDGRRLLFRREWLDEYLEAPRTDA